MTHNTGSGRGARQRAAYYLGAVARADAERRREAERREADAQDGTPAPWHVEPPDLDPDAVSDDQRVTLERIRRRLGG